MKLSKLYATQILDSRGNPTIEVIGTLENGMSAKADVPSGASKGSHEALELRDEDPKIYDGKGVLKAVTNVNKIFEAIKDIDIQSQREIDLKMIELDGTSNKSKLGANAMLGVSIVCMKLSAKLSEKEYFEHINSQFNLLMKKDVQLRIPIPMFNILNGGQHVDNGIDFQEFMVIPITYSSYVTSKTFIASQKSSEKQLQMVVEIFHELKNLLKFAKKDDGVGDEGGFAPLLPGPKDALNLICEAAMRKGYKLNEDFSFGIDCASNYYYDKKIGKYTLGSHVGNPITKTKEELKDYYSFFLTHYPLIYLEDFFEEDDFESFASVLNDEEFPRILYCGDDLVVTNAHRLKEAIEKSSVNSIIVKPNQIGTIYETFEVINMCIENNIVYVPSHRSGETNDPFITDLAVGTGAMLLKAGAPDRGERVAKYNRLIEIARKLEKA